MNMSEIRNQTLRLSANNFSQVSVLEADFAVETATTTTTSIVGERGILTPFPRLNLIFHIYLANCLQAAIVTREKHAQRFTEFCAELKLDSRSRERTSDLKLLLHLSDAIVDLILRCKGAEGAYIDPTALVALDRAEQALCVAEQYADTGLQYNLRYTSVPQHYLSSHMYFSASARLYSLTAQFKTNTISEIVNETNGDVTFVVARNTCLSVDIDNELSYIDMPNRRSGVRSSSSSSSRYTGKSTIISEEKCTVDVVNHVTEMRYSTREIELLAATCTLAGAGHAAAAAAAPVVSKLFTCTSIITTEDNLHKLRMLSSAPAEFVRLCSICKCVRSKQKQLKLLLESSACSSSVAQQATAGEDRNERCTTTDVDDVTVYAPQEQEEEQGGVSSIELDCLRHAIRYGDRCVECSRAIKYALSIGNTSAAHCLQLKLDELEDCFHVFADMESIRALCVKVDAAAAVERGSTVSLANLHEVAKKATSVGASFSVTDPVILEAAATATTTTTAPDTAGNTTVPSSDMLEDEIRAEAIGARVISYKTAAADALCLQVALQEGDGPTVLRVRELSKVNSARESIISFVLERLSANTHWSTEDSARAEEKEEEEEEEKEERKKDTKEEYQKDSSTPCSASSSSFSSSVAADSSSSSSSTTRVVQELLRIQGKLYDELSTVRQTHNTYRLALLRACLSRNLKHCDNVRSTLIKPTRSDDTVTVTHHEKEARRAVESVRQRLVYIEKSMLGENAMEMHTLLSAKRVLMDGIYTIRDVIDYVIRADVDHDADDDEENGRKSVGHTSLLSRETADEERLLLLGQSIIHHDARAPPPAAEPSVVAATRCCIDNDGTFTAGQSTSCGVHTMNSDTAATAAAAAVSEFTSNSNNFWILLIQRTEALSSLCIKSALKYCLAAARFRRRSYTRDILSTSALADSGDDITELFNYCGMQYHFLTLVNSRQLTELCSPPTARRDDDDVNAKQQLSTDELNFLSTQPVLQGRMLRCCRVFDDLLIAEDPNSVDHPSQPYTDGHGLWSKLMDTVKSNSFFMKPRTVLEKQRRSHYGDFSDICCWRDTLCVFQCDYKVLRVLRDLLTLRAHLKQAAARTELIDDTLRRLAVLSRELLLSPEDKRIENNNDEGTKKSNQPDCISNRATNSIGDIEHIIEAIDVLPRDDVVRLALLILTLSNSEQAKIVRTAVTYGIEASNLQKQLLKSPLRCSSLRIRSNEGATTVSSSTSTSNTTSSDDELLRSMIADLILAAQYCIASLECNQLATDSKAKVKEGHPLLHKSSTSSVCRGVEALTLTLSGSGGGGSDDAYNTEWKKENQQCRGKQLMKDAQCTVRMWRQWARQRNIEALRAVAIADENGDWSEEK